MGWNTKIALTYCQYSLTKTQTDLSRPSYSSRSPARPAGSLTPTTCCCYRASAVPPCWPVLQPAHSPSTAHFKQAKTEKNIQQQHGVSRRTDLILVFMMCFFHFSIRALKRPCASSSHLRSVVPLEPIAHVYTRGRLLSSQHTKDHLLTTTTSSSSQKTPSIWLQGFRVWSGRITFKLSQVSSAEETCSSYRVFLT